MPTVMSTLRHTVPQDCVAPAQTHTRDASASRRLQRAKIIISTYLIMYVVVDSMEIMTIRVFIALSVVLLINIHPAKDHPLTTLGIETFTSRLLPAVYSSTSPKMWKQNKSEQPKSKKPARLSYFHRLEPETDVKYEPKPKPQSHPNVKQKQKQAYNIKDEPAIREGPISPNCTIHVYQGFPDGPKEMIWSFHAPPRRSDSPVVTDARLQAEAPEDVQKDPIPSPVEEIELPKPSDALSPALVHCQPPCKIQMDLPSDTIPLQEASVSTLLTNRPSANSNVALVPYRPLISKVEELHQSTPACTPSAVLASNKRDDCFDLTTAASIILNSQIHFLRRVLRPRSLYQPTSSYVLPAVTRQILDIQSSVTCRALACVPKPATIHTIDAVTSMTSSCSSRQKLILAIRAPERFITAYTTRGTLKQNVSVPISTPRLTRATSALITGSHIMARHLMRSGINSQMRAILYLKSSIASIQRRELSLIGFTAKPAKRAEETAISKDGAPLDSQPLNSTRSLIPNLPEMKSDLISPNTLSTASLQPILTTPKVFAVTLNPNGTPACRVALYFRSIRMLPRSISFVLWPLATPKFIMILSSMTAQLVSPRIPHESCTRIVEFDSGKPHSNSVDSTEQSEAPENDIQKETHLSCLSDCLELSKEVNEEMDAILGLLVPSPPFETLFNMTSADGGQVLPQFTPWNFGDTSLIEASPIGPFAGSEEIPHSVAEWMISPPGDVVSECEDGFAYCQGLEEIVPTGSVEEVPTECLATSPPETVTIQHAPSYLEPDFMYITWNEPQTSTNVDQPPSIPLSGSQDFLLATPSNSENPLTLLPPVINVISPTPPPSPEAIFNSPDTSALWPYWEPHSTSNQISIADTFYLPQADMGDQSVDNPDEQATSPVQACYSALLSTEDALKSLYPDLTPLHDGANIQENNFAHWMPEMETPSHLPAPESSVSFSSRTWSYVSDVDVTTMNSGILPVLPASQPAPSEPVLDNFTLRWQHPLSVVLHSEQPALMDVLATLESSGLGATDLAFIRPLPAPQAAEPAGDRELATSVPLAINPTLDAIMPLSNCVLNTSSTPPSMPSVLQNKAAAITETTRPTRSLPRRHTPASSVAPPLPLPAIPQHPTDEDDTAAAKEYDEEAEWAEFDMMVEAAHRAENNEYALFDTAAMDRHRDSLPSSLFLSPVDAVLPVATPVLAPAEVVILPSACADPPPSTTLAPSEDSQEQPPLIAGNDEDDRSVAHSEEDEWAAFDQELEEMMAEESSDEDEDESPAVFDTDAMARHGFILTPQGTLVRSDHSSSSPPPIASNLVDKTPEFRVAKRGFSPEPVSAEIEQPVSLSDNAMGGSSASINQTPIVRDNTIPPSPPQQYQAASISPSVSTVAIEPATPPPTIEELRCAGILRSLCNDSGKFSGADDVSPQTSQFHFDSEPENDDSMSGDDYTLLEQDRIRKRRNSDAEGTDHPMKYDTEAMERHVKEQIDLEALRTALCIANLKYSKPSGWQPVQLAVNPSKRPYFDGECEEDDASELYSEGDEDQGDRPVSNDANAPSSVSIQLTDRSQPEDNEVGCGRSDLVDASAVSKACPSHSEHDPADADAESENFKIDKEAMKRGNEPMDLGRLEGAMLLMGMRYVNSVECDRQPKRMQERDDDDSDAPLHSEHSFRKTKMARRTETFD